MNITYMYGGVEGAAHRSCVLNEANYKHCFLSRLPPNTYLHADAGFHPLALSCPKLCRPYHWVRNHVKEVDASEPGNKEELLNLRHSNQRTTIKRTFGMFKQRFRIYKGPPKGYTLVAQSKLLYVLAVLHNFVNMRGEGPPSSIEDTGEEEAVGYHGEEGPKTPVGT